VKWPIVLLVTLLAPVTLPCQQGQYQASTRSPHGSLNLPCQACHTSTSWKPIRARPDFDHNKTQYPLRGMHASIGSCTQCHTKLVFTEVGQSCADCHADIHRGQMGAKCEGCHSVKGWQVSIQDIKQHQNRFPLIGAHSALSCDSCHKGAATGQFVGLSTACTSCHEADFERASNPNHSALGFPRDCQQCHSMNSWLGAQFDHAKFTGFALTGAHIKLECSQCHVNSNLTNASTNCVGCHLSDFNRTTNPNHRTAGFSQDCSTCHNTTSWLNTTFDHSKTSFPLTGAHAALQCSQCHSAASFASAPTQCVGCHLANFQQTTNPNHVTGGFPQACEQCHNTSSWLNASFDHSKTAFPLTGAHASVQCSQCHTGGNFSNAPRQCAGCHLATFQHTTNPNHVAAGFPTDCSICHSTTNWLGATFDHSKTAFPLTGAHVGLACSGCHSSGVFAGLPTTCVSCHLKEFQQTTNPNHVTSGFPQDCTLCHSTANWTSSTFDHSKTVFPLTGAHITVACSSCHINGNFTTTPTDCYSCHKAQYTGATNPNHVTAAFPTTCQTCHNTTAWTGATFNHTWFPIYSGTHKGVWTTCADCHVNPADYTAFTCIACHTHNKTDTDSHHRGVRNYVYAPTACYSCHKG